MDEPTIGPLLRRLREAEGLSQAELAERLSDRSGRPVTRNEVSRWENEKRLLTPFWQHHYAASLDTSIGELRAAVTAAKARRRRERQLIADEGPEPVVRRAFLSNSIAIASAAAMIPQIAHIEAGRRVGPDLVERLKQRTARLRRLDDLLGGSDTYQLYASELAATTRLVNEANCTEDTRKGLLSVMAEQAQQAGWAAFDAGRHAEAERLYRTSLTAALEGSDAALAGNALAFLAYQQVSIGRSGVAMASASCVTAGDDCSAGVGALLWERRAWAHAVAGHVGECERALHRANTCLRQRELAPPPDWASWVDATELHIMAGRCWSVLHRPRRAIPLLEEALSGFDNAHARDKSLYLTWLADAYLDADEIERAIATISHAVDLAAGVGSVRPVQRLASLLDRVTVHRGVAGVADLVERAAHYVPEAVAWSIQAR
jgi:transcriptional regulator with XRE-family HTH domain